jgi:rare lipoprotein A
MITAPGKSAVQGALLVVVLVALLTACSHPKQAQVKVPPPPPPSEELPPAQPITKSPEPNSKAATRTPEEPSPAANSEPDSAEPEVPQGTKPILTETGMASWYGPPYHNRRGSNGELYNMHAMTAAHRTLPLGAIVRVTNVKTGSSALVRITDRGPFIPGRVVDLSLAAARKVDVYQPGVARVKVEVLETPVPIDFGGKWAVQIGGFPHEEKAHKLAEHLEHRYRTSQVLCFKSPAGDWWIRVRVLDDDHSRAQKLVAETETPEGAVFLVRLD